MQHEINVRVYYEDTDAGGIVYHASFIRFCERGRAELLRSVDITCPDLEEQIGTKFVVRHMECDYYRPSRLDDWLMVKTCVISMKNSSFVMKQSIFCHENHLFDMKVTLVCIDKSGRPMRVPAILRDKFEPFLEQNADE